MKIQLVNAPLSKKYAPTIRAAAFPPMNLIALATYIKKHDPSLEIEIIDGELKNILEILEDIDGDIVGISSNSLTYDNALEIAKAAKDIKAKVIIGGPHVNTVGENILRNRSYIDVAVYGDGEDAILNLIKDFNYQQLTNIIYRNGNKVVKTRSQNMSIENMPFPDYSFIDLTPYAERFRNIYPQKPFYKPFAMFSAKGCAWRMSTKGCIFCAVTESGLRIKNPKRVWDEVIWHEVTFGADFIWDASDSFTMQKKWINDLVRSKPKECNVRFHVYGRANDINEEMADLLSRLGVYEILIGFESGNDVILQNTRKGTTVADGRKAAKILHSYGIKVIPSIILGLPGETTKSMGDSYNFASDLVRNYDIQEGYCSMVLPLPGSQMMKKLAMLPSSTIDMNSDIFDFEELRHLWLENFTEVNYDLVIKKRSEIASLFPLAGSLAKPSNSYR